MFLHPVTSSASAVSGVEREGPGGKSVLPPTTAKKIPGLTVHSWTSFHGFTKKAPSCIMTL